MAQDRSRCRRWLGSCLVLAAGLVALSSAASAQCDEETKLTAGNDVEDYGHFGRAVALWGDTILVGVYSGDFPAPGSFKIFERDAGGPGNWGEVIERHKSPEEFGHSVALVGDTAVVGAPDADALYLFERDEGGADNWGEVDELTAPGLGLDDFGHAVAFDGETIAVGAHFDDPPAGTNAGSAYVFTKDGVGNWRQVKHLLAPDGAEHDNFGKSVAVDGDTVVVGAIGADGQGGYTGAAYLFQRDEGGPDNWGYLLKLTASDGANFGWAVAIEGDTILVSNHSDDDHGSGSGSVYVFREDEGGAGQWGEALKITASDAAAGDQFGRALALSGDTAIVGALQNTNGGGDQAGAAYLFRRHAGGFDRWGEVAKLTASDGAAEDLFGHDVAIDGNRALVSAFGDDIGGTIESGSVYVLRAGLGTPYCTTSPNSVGPGMFLSARGARSLAEECVTLRADGGPDDKPGLFFFGPNQLAGVPFGEGLRCVGGATRRIQPPAATGPANGDPAGTALRTLDFQLPYALFLTAAPPATNFQYWYRDPAGGPAGFNLSDALAVDFLP